MANVSNGFIELKSGMNSSRNPVLLPDSQCAKAINVSFRGGLASTRPAFSEFGASTPPVGEFRGAGQWSLEGHERIVYVVAGSVYLLELDTGAVSTITALSSVSGPCYFLQADRFFVIQDSVSDPVVLEDSDGIVAITAHTVTLPAGYFGIYAHGRIHMVPKVVPNTSLTGKPYLVSSDIMQPSEPESVLLTEETEYLSEGGAHALPAEMGFIGGLGVLRNAQTGTGLGSVVALARNGLCAFDFSISRTVWKEQSLSNVLFFGAGCRSPRGVVSLNDDLVYRSTDGIRTLKYSASQLSGSSGSLSNTPMSYEVQEFLDPDSAFLPLVSMAVSDNRLFCTAGSTGTGSFNGLVVWDVAAAYYSGAAGVGAYDGLWTGARFKQVLSALSGDSTRMFAFTDDNRLYRIEENAVLDPGDTPIEARIETKAYNFGDMVTTKKLHFVDVWLSDIVVDTEVKVWYRPHGYPLWKLLGTRTVLVPTGSLPQTRGGLRFSVDYSAENCDPISGQPLYAATMFQFSLQWTGRATIDTFQANAELVPDAPPDPCGETEGVVLATGSLSGDLLNDFSYNFGGTD